MLKAILQEMKSRLQKDCPYEVRYAHSRMPVPEQQKPFLLLDVTHAAADAPSAEGAGRLRYPVTAVISVKAVVPLQTDSAEMQRIAAAYVLPAMIRSGCTVTDITMDSQSDNRLLKRHVMEIQFRLKGVYTMVWEDEV